MVYDYEAEKEAIRQGEHDAYWYGSDTNLNPYDGGTTLAYWYEDARRNELNRLDEGRTQ